MRSSTTFVMKHECFNEEKEESLLATEHRKHTVNKKSILVGNWGYGNLF